MSTLLLQPAVLEAAITAIIAGEKRFSVEEMFDHNRHGPKTRVSTSFREWFYDLIEDPRPEAEILTYTRMKKSVNEQDVLKRYDETTMREIRIAHLHELMSMTDAGEPALLTHGYANVCRANDVTGVRRLVYALRSPQGWFIGASYDEPVVWRDGLRIISRKAYLPRLLA